MKPKKYRKSKLPIAGIPIAQFFKENHTEMCWLFKNTEESNYFQRMLQATAYRKKTKIKCIAIQGIAKEKTYITLLVTKY